MAALTFIAYFLGGALVGSIAGLLVLLLIEVRALRKDVEAIREAVVARQAAGS